MNHINKIFAVLTLAVVSVPAVQAACTDPAGPNVNWAGCNKNGIRVPGANLAGAKFNNATFQDTKKHRADFTNANLAGADFLGAQVGPAIFNGANLAGARWTDGRICATPSIGRCNVGPAASGTIAAPSPTPPVVSPTPPAPSAPISGGGNGSAAGTNQTDPLACLKNSPMQTSAVYFNTGTGQKENATLQLYTSKCLRLFRAGPVVLTTANEAGGVSCAGNIIQVDAVKASKAQAGILESTFAVACYEAVVPGAPKPSGPPPDASGPWIRVYAGYFQPLDIATLVAVTPSCYQISRAGAPGYLWFPKSALKYTTDIPGNPIALDYLARRDKPCD